MINIYQYTNTSLGSKDSKDNILNGTLNVIMVFAF